MTAVGSTNTSEARQFEAMSRTEHAAPSQAAYATPAERAARGRAARARAPRSSHSALELPAERDPIALLEAQARSRLADLVPIRYGRMAASPFSFFRGAATVMAHDLASTPTAGLTVQLSGDAHLANFGGFASPERRQVFDLNDFDETHPGPFEWDVKRMAASFEIVARERDFGGADRAQAVLGAGRAYREAMLQFAALGDLDVWYARLDLQDQLTRLGELHDKKLAAALERSAATARRHDHMRALAKLTHVVDGEPRFVSNPPLLVPLAELAGSDDDSEGLASQLRALFEAYRRTLAPDRRRLLERFRYVDLARRVVGIGSVGTRCWVLLLLGLDESDPLFLQIKEAEASVLEPYLGRSRFRQHGRRVVEGQRLMQAAGDIFLGWIHAKEELRGGGTDYYVRQLWDWKRSVDVDTIKPEGLTLYAQACGQTLARAHARSGDRVAIAAYLGRSDRFDRAIAEFAAAYADRNERDHHALVQAAAEGRIAAAEDV